MLVMPMIDPAFRSAPAAERKAPRVCHGLPTKPPRHHRGFFGISWSPHARRKYLLRSSQRDGQQLAKSKRWQMRHHSHQIISTPQAYSEAESIGAVTCVPTRFFNFDPTASNPATEVETPLRLSAHPRNHFRQLSSAPLCLRQRQPSQQPLLNSPCSSNRAPGTLRKGAAWRCPCRSGRSKSPS
jgi:hypothetical protein